MRWISHFQYRRSWSPDSKTRLVVYPATLMVLNVIIVILLSNVLRVYDNNFIFICWKRQQIHQRTKSRIPTSGICDDSFPERKGLPTILVYFVIAAWWLLLLNNYSLMSLDFLYIDLKRLFITMKKEAGWQLASIVTVVKKRDFSQQQENVANM